MTGEKAGDRSPLRTGAELALAEAFRQEAEQYRTRRTGWVGRATHASRPHATAAARSQDGPTGRTVRS